MRNKIAELHMELAYFVAKREAERRILEREDLNQLALIGLLKAIEKFDPSNGAAFSSFAVPYIRGEIQHFCRDHETTVKVPRRWREIRDSVEAAWKKIRASGRDVSMAEVAISKGFSLAEWQEIEAATGGVRMTSAEDDEVLQLADEWIDPGDRDAAERLEDAVLARLSELPKLKRDCVTEYYWAGLKPGVIAARHKVSVKSVETLISEGLEQMRGANAVNYHS
ncbi:MAG: sigma-70 family RNA polymerase sigma factor [Cyanobacteria bacterium J06635_1]